MKTGTIDGEQIHPTEASSDNAMEHLNAVYYCTIWVIGFITGISRTVHNGNYQGLGHCLTVGLFSGCLAFAAVALLDGHQHDIEAQSVFYMGVAAAIGPAGREQVLILNYLVDKVMEFLGIQRNGKPSGNENE